MLVLALRLAREITKVFVCGARNGSVHIRDPWPTTPKKLPHFLGRAPTKALEILAGRKDSDAGGATATRSISARSGPSPNRPRVKNSRARVLRQQKKVKPPRGHGAAQDGHYQDRAAHDHSLEQSLAAVASVNERQGPLRERSCGHQDFPSVESAVMGGVGAPHQPSVIGRITGLEAE